MLEKIFYSMVHGNIKTKIFLWSVVILGLSAVFLLLAGLVLGMPSLMMGGVAFGFVGLIVSQSVSLHDLQRQKETKKKKEKEPKERGIKESQEAEGQEHPKKEKGAQEADWDGMSRQEKERIKTQYLSSMTQKKLKKMMKEHKVNQIHVKVMIDRYPARQIEQAPAFMWRTDTMLHFLVLTGQAEEFEVPLADIQGFLLVRHVPADKEMDYVPFRKSSFLTNMFQPYLPEYFESTKDGKLEITKNTFRIEPGIYLTNSSVANLKKVLLPGVAFLVDDKVMASKRFNEYFKELYRYSLLCKNMVITLDEYRGQIQKTLDALLDAPISGREFASTVQDLNKYRLITQNDATLYAQKYRERNM